MRGSGAVSTNLKEGDVEQNAERATVRSKDGKDSIQLQCTDGQWRVDIGALIRGQDVVRVVPVFRAAGIAARKVADDIESGKCKTVDEAKQSMSAQIGAALPELVRKELSPSTAPAPSPVIDSFDNLAK